MSSAPWTDLSRPLHEGSDRGGRVAPPALRPVMTLEDDPFAIQELTISTHVGTHLDAPSHFIADGATIDEIPLARVIGPGVVLEIAGESNVGFGAEELAAGGPEPRPGDIVMLRTGWEAKAETPAYFEHPYLTESAVAWLIEHEVGMVGMDLITPEMPEAVREGEFTWPVHRALMGEEILVMENVCNLRSLARTRIEVIAAPINIKGADGAPVRLLARPAEAGS